jgi:hypothetical protein
MEMQQIMDILMCRMDAMNKKMDANTETTNAKMDANTKATLATQVKMDETQEDMKTMQEKAEAGQKKIQE